MILEKRKPSGREKDEEAVKLLEQLREKLYVDDISAARRAAFNLSWKQEDGLDILKEALLNNSPRTAKIAAVYGLRNMHGRMKKLAMAVLEEGLKHRKTDIRNACVHALSLAIRGPQEKSPSQRPPKSGRIEIREVRGRRTSGRQMHTRRMNERNHRGRR
jgi:hypothetical protein